MSATIRVDGLRDVTRKLTRLGAEVDDLKDVFHEVGQIVVDTAQGRVRRRTGALADSIRASRTRNKAAVRAGGRHTWYAVPRERGTRYQPADEYLASSIRDNETRITTTTDAGLRRILSKLNL